MQANGILQQHRAVIVPFPVAHEEIPQSTLEELIELRRKADAIEADIRRRIGIGASVQPGRLGARLETNTVTQLVVEE